MKRHLTAFFVILLGIMACGEKPPADWMYAEYRSLYLACPEFGEKVDRTKSTASLTYTWSCPYPENFESWLSEFEGRYLSPRGWTAANMQSPDKWKTYCKFHKKVVMRIGKAAAKKSNESDRLWVSIRFPGDECQNVVNSLS